MSVAAMTATAPLTIDDVLPRLKRLRKTRRGWACQCPAHPDRRNSLSVGIGRNGKVLLYCHAQCRYQEVLAALGLEWPAEPSRRQPARPLSPMAEARQTILHEAQHQVWAKPGVVESYEIADMIRRARQEAHRLNEAATAAGDSPDSWTMVDLAARLETEILQFETELDESATRGTPRDPRIIAAWRRMLARRTTA